MRVPVLCVPRQTRSYKSAKLCAKRGVGPAPSLSSVTTAMQQHVASPHKVGIHSRSSHYLTVRVGVVRVVVRSLPRAYNSLRRGKEVRQGDRVLQLVMRHTHKKGALLLRVVVFLSCQNNSVQTTRRRAMGNRAAKRS